MGRLRDANSLYLRQHADNPVDWWPFGEAAFAEASRRDVPVLLSIGYAACHWCHVMAHECFEDPGVAAKINEACVPIKVDREERPDVDALYMAATVAMNGHGGWPMTVLCAPDGRPFFAGTYFPARGGAGHPGLVEILASATELWSSRRAELLEQADRLTDAVRREARLLDAMVAIPGKARRSAASRLEALVDELAARYDQERGGFSPAPKFPHPSYVEACMALAVATGRHDAREMASRTLGEMSRGGLFDHVAGGFARYSVDTRWEVPHFEKMLSDQALLARCYLRAGAWLDEPDASLVARRTLDFVLDEMRVPDGFASAIDADAGGVEGGHVVLGASVVRAVLEDAGIGDVAARTIARYRVSEDPEGSVPRLAVGEDFAGDEMDEAARRALRAYRQRIARPAVDDKVLLEWNAMLAAALAEAAWRLGEPRYGTEASALIDGLFSTHLLEGSWRRRSGADAPRATSADLAWLIIALTTLFELDGDPRHLRRATLVAAALVEGHWVGAVPTHDQPDLGEGLYQSHRDVTGLLVRAKDVLDGATPSGASASAVALARLSMCASSAATRSLATRLVALAGPLLDAHATAAATLVEAACLLELGVEVAVPGEAGPALAAARAAAPPFSVVVAGHADIALLEGRADGLVYVCRDASCEAPVGELASVAPALARAARWDTEGR